MRKTFLITIAGAALTVACHGAPPPEKPAPRQTGAEIALEQQRQDSLDAVQRATADSASQAALASQALADSVARAQADSIEQARLADEAAARDLATAAAKNTELRDELGVMVHFEVGQAEISADGTAALDRKVAILNANPDLRLRITGACDERGSDQFNHALGERRAAAVRRYLIEKGIDAARLDEISTGESSPIASGSNEEAWARNRRAEFAVVSGDSPLAMP